MPNLSRNLKKLFAVGLVGGSLLLSACSTNQPAAPAAQGSGSQGSTGDQAFKIGLLLPETAVARYESKDKPYFEAAMKQLCAACEVLYANANSDAAAQQQQARSMLTQKVNVLVVDPFDGVAAASIVNSAKAAGVPVVAYDRLIKSPDLTYVISNDYEQVGKLQGKSLVDKLKADKADPASGGLLMINGASTDDNARTIRAGAMSEIEGSGYKVLASTDTWDPDKAQKWTAGQINKYRSQILGVYSANDGNIGGAIAAFKSAGVSPVPPGTGLDASVAGLQAILAGNQYMSTYNAFKIEAQSAASVAYDLAQGKTPPAPARVGNIPATLNKPVVVTADNIQSTVIADGFYKASEICTAQYKKACDEHGIK